MARVGSNAFAAISTIFLARLLTPADFGIVALATSMLLVLQAFTDFSLTQALVRNAETTDEHLNSAWSLNVGRGLAVAILFAGSAPIFAKMYDDKRLALVMVALSLIPLISGAANPRLALLKKNLNFHQDALLVISSTFTSAILSIVFAYYYRSYWALVAGSVAGQIINLAISYIIFPYLPKIGFSKVRELWGFSFWVSLGQIVNTLNYRFDEILVGSLLGKRDLGLYTVGGKLAKIPGQEIVRPLTATLFPAFTAAAKDPARLTRAYVRTQGIATAIALPTGLGFAVVAASVVALFLGPKWGGAVLVIQLVSAVSALETLGTLANPLGMALGQTKSLFTRNCVKLAIRVPLMAIGIFWHGLLGLLVARMIAGFISVIIDMRMVKLFLGLSILGQFLANIRCFLASATMVVSILGIQYLFEHSGFQPDSAMMLTFCVIAGIATYVGSTVALWLIAGKPRGPETEILDLLQTMRERFRKNTNQ